MFYVNEIEYLILWVVDDKEGLGRKDENGNDRMER